MTFTEVKGDLFSRPMCINEFYVHYVSRDYACGAGIAKEFNKRYNLTIKLRNSGDNSKCILIDNVFNLVTKSKYWQKPTYGSLRFALDLLKVEVTDSKLVSSSDQIDTLVMPRIGCGLDKLQWKNVKDIIKDVFKDTDISIEVWYL